MTEQSASDVGNYKLSFADDINGLAEQKQELVKLVNHLEETPHGIWYADQCREDPADDK